MKYRPETYRADAKSLFAEFGVRLAAIAVDFFIVMLMAQGARTYLLEPMGIVVLDHRVVLIVVAFLYLAIYWYCPMKATPAQFVLGLRVIDTQGNKLSFGRAALRSVLLIGVVAASMTLFRVLNYPYLVVVALPAYALVFLAAVTPARQSAHDLLAGTLVVNRFALASPVNLERLQQHVNDRKSDTSRFRQPSVLSIFGNLLVLAVPIVILFTFAQVQNDRDLRARIGYAIGNVAELKNAVEIYYIEHDEFPASDVVLAAASRGDYPDGGYYLLEDDGVIRIRFTVIPALTRIEIVLAAIAGDEGVAWACHTEGEISAARLPAVCRDSVQTGQ